MKEAQAASFEDYLSGIETFFGCGELDSMGPFNIISSYKLNF